LQEIGGNADVSLNFHYSFPVSSPSRVLNCYFFCINLRPFFVPLSKAFGPPGGNKEGPALRKETTRKRPQVPLPLGPLLTFSGSEKLRGKQIRRPRRRFLRSAGRKLLGENTVFSNLVFHWPSCSLKPRKAEPSGPYPTKAGCPSTRHAESFSPSRREEDEAGSFSRRVGVEICRSKSLVCRGPQSPSHGNWPLGPSERHQPRQAKGLPFRPMWEVWRQCSSEGRVSRVYVPLGGGRLLTTGPGPAPNFAITGVLRNFFSKGGKIDPCTKTSPALPSLMFSPVGRETNLPLTPTGPG